jgi:tripartite-type tricarboxylate transporter receptor subunit TctC
VKIIFISLIALLNWAFSNFSYADAADRYPWKPIRIIVGFAPGGPTDRVAREVAAKLQEAWGQTVIVENKPGAGGRIAFELVLNATPDGHTLLVSGVQAATNIVVYRDPGFNTLRDFAPVSQLTSTTLVLAINPKLPVRSVRELLAWSKSKGSPTTYATSGVGSSPHFASAWFEQIAQTEMTHVPFSGASGAQTAVISGVVDIAFVSPLSATTLLQDGKLRALAVTSPTRQATFPTIPTMMEAGVTGFEVSSWQGMLAPAGTPERVIEKLHRELSKALLDADVKTRLNAVAAEPVASSPAEFRKYIESEIAKWRTVAQKANLIID